MNLGTGGKDTAGRRAQGTPARPAGAPNWAIWAYAGLNAKRTVRDWSNLVFNIALPVILYLIFGASQDIRGESFPGGNIAAFVMVGMALYAGVTAAVSAASSTIIEHRSGWGRQLSLTPMSSGQLLAAHALVIFFRSTLSVSAVFIAGAIVGAEMPLSHWVASFALTCAMALPFGFYGLVWVLLVPTENTVAIASSSVVLLAFIGNLFLPLAQSLLDFARFTPIYGAAALARWPVSEGYQVVKEAPFVVADPLWAAVANYGVWTAAFVLGTFLLERRDKTRR